MLVHPFTILQLSSSYTRKFTLPTGSCTEVELSPPHPRVPGSGPAATGSGREKMAGKFSIRFAPGTICPICVNKSPLPIYYYIYFFQRGLSLSGNRHRTPFYNCKMKTRPCFTLTTGSWLCLQTLDSANSLGFWERASLLCQIRNYSGKKVLEYWP